MNCAIKALRIRAPIRGILRHRATNFPLRYEYKSYRTIQPKHLQIPHFNFGIEKKPILFQQYRNAATKAPTKIIHFNLADVGEGIRECEVVKWNVSEGEKVHEFQKICELLSDKASVEITSRYEGTIRKLHYKAGEIAFVGKPLIDIEVVAEEGTAKSLEKLEEDRAEDISYENVNEEIIAIKENEENGGILDTEAYEYQIITTRGGPVKIMAAPSVRRIAVEKKVNLGEVKPTGKNGRILKEDILLYLSQNPSRIEKTNKAKNNNNVNKNEEKALIGDTLQTTNEFIKKDEYSKEDKEVVIKGIQKQMVKSMTAAASIPHFGYREEIIVDELIRVRSALKVLAEEQKIKLSYLPFFLKACSVALKDFPVLNAHVNADASTVTYKASHNIGIAMDTPAGLLVPNIKNVQDKTILEIAQDINRLQALGKEGKIPLNDLKGGTITLSNIGNIGGTYAAPVLFLPEVAIAAIGRIQRVPRFDADQNPYPVNFINISWSADHRVIDGATMARFVAKMKFLLENPISFLASLK